MVKVKSIEKKIWDVEEFDVELRHLNGDDVRSDRGNLPQYDKKRKAKNDMTVREWKDTRFSQRYPGFNVKVLDGDGNDVPGQTKLGTVRDSYSDSDDE